MSSARMSIFCKALLPAFAVIAAAPAFADGINWVSRNQMTVFNDAYSRGCQSKPGVITYTTQSEDTKYRGRFFVKRVVGCPTGRSSFLGYFEDFSVPSAKTNRREGCKGDLMMGMTGNSVEELGTVKWSNIKPVKGYVCKSTGKTISITLIGR